jgi:hypothetical protein
MPLKYHSENWPQRLSAGLFCQARLIELMSIAQRIGDHAAKTPLKAAEEDPVEGCASIGPRQRLRAPIFHMRVDPSGWWEIRENNGSKAGLFRTRQAAIKFARDESPGGQFVIIDNPA